MLRTVALCLPGGLATMGREEGAMVGMIVWIVLGVGIFFWNMTRTPYIGIRFTDQLLGFPISGAWLCAACALYCLIRFYVRRAKERKGAPE
jgi:uncharacterized metal-binding protein